jgi:ATP-dependent protease HslVU (ClpYQ) peptidase subunit
MTYMVTQFIKCVRALLKDEGLAKIETNVEQGGRFLVGYRGKLYSVASDYQVGHMSDEFDVIGSGNEFALAAMKALADLPPTKRIKKALEISAYFNMGVCPPFNVKSMRLP